jgi:hypothetical protein
VCAAALLLVAAVVAQRRAIARSLIEAQLRDLGLEEVVHVVERLGFAQFGARDLRVGGDDDLVVDRIDARYSLSSLMVGRLEELSIRGVRLRGTFDGESLSFGALDALLHSEAGGEAERAQATAPPARFVALPATNIAIEDVAVRLETPQGPLTASFAAHVRDAGGGDITADATLTAQHALLAAAARVEARGTAAGFEGDASLELSTGGAVGSEAVLAPTELALAAGFAYADERIEVEVASAPFAVALSSGGETFRIEGETPAISLAMPPAPGGPASVIHVASAGGRFGLPDLDLEARDIAVDADIDPETGLPSGSFRVAALADTQSPPRLAELALAGKFATAATGIEFEFTVANSDRQLELGTGGKYDPATGSGEVRVTLKPLVFEPDGLQPAALAPLLGEAIESASGSIEASGTAAWEGDGTVRTSFDLTLRELSVWSELGGVEGLTADIHLDGPWPAATPPEQRMSMARVDFGLELTNGLVVFQIRPDGVLDLASAKWSLAGGAIQTRGEIDLGADTQELVLELADIDLAELLTLVDLEDLAGSGRLRGRIPVLRRGQTLEIRGGKLSAAEPGGWIRYRADAGVAGAASQGLEFDPLAALENFHYEELVVGLDGDTLGPVKVAIHLAGVNPDYFDGHPIEFNLNLEARLADLLQKGTAVYRLPEKIEQMIQKKMQETQ